MKVERLLSKSTLYILLAIFPTCSFAGLAALLRSRQPLTQRAIVSACLNSGFFGVCVAALMIHRFGPDSIYLIIGVSLLSGLGGNTAIDFVLEAAKTYIRKREE